MPHVLVQCSDDFARSSGALSYIWLKDAIRARASQVLTTPDITLRPMDFSFMFLREGPDDSLIKDLQVIILAHAAEVRVENSDRLAAEIGDAVENVISSSFSVSVSLFLGEMGYFAGAGTLKP